MYNIINTAINSSILWIILKNISKRITYNTLCNICNNKLSKKPCVNLLIHYEYPIFSK